MQTGKSFLLTAVLISLSSAAYAQTATELQQQKTEAAVAGQAARTKAATQDQQLKTMAASEEQARKTQAAVQDQANQTAARAQQNQGTQTRVYTGTGGTIVQTGNATTYYPEMASPALTGANEINQAQRPASISDSAEKQLQSLFNTIDTDHNGLISKTEFSIYYKSGADDPRFDGYDVNRDMYLSYFEFRAPNVSGSSINVPSH